MSDKDPPPFGYTFSDDFFGGGASAPFDNTGGQSLLNETENQSLADFFSNTDPFPADAKDSAHDYTNWDDFIAPATVHRVTTTIPDQAHLQHSFHHDHTFAPSLPTNYLGNTHDDLQAASTLFNNTQPSYSNARAHDSGSSQNALPIVFTPHGLINEQLAAFMPNHADGGALDTQLAAQWGPTNAQPQHETQFGQLFQKPSMKRSYTFGTDNSFNDPAGYSAPHGQECDHQLARRSAQELQQSQHLLRTVAGVNGPAANPTGHVHLPAALAANPSDDEQSEEATSEEDDNDRPAKKRRKSKYRVGKDSPRKGARNSKNRKASFLDESSKKKRASAAAQKLQRENLTEEQKRSNHILSEQKRRNLIKRGFDDLHNLVPEIRNGGLSKSSVLMEAGNFLEKLIQDNTSFWQLSGGIPGASSG